MNVLVQNCKIYNDASCDISADGQLLAAFIPSSQRGFPDEGILAVYSLAPHNLGEMLYTKRFGKSPWMDSHGGGRNTRDSSLTTYSETEVQPFRNKQIKYFTAGGKMSVES